MLVAASSQHYVTLDRPLQAVALTRSATLPSPTVFFLDTYRYVAWWLSGRALDLQFTGRGFKSRPVAFT